MVSCETDLDHEMVSCEMKRELSRLTYHLMKYYMKSVMNTLYEIKCEMIDYDMVDGKIRDDR